MELDLTELRKHKLVIATPMYGGNVTSGYNISMINLFYYSGIYNLSVQSMNVWNDSLITRARNHLVHKFLNESDAELFLFIDADISFDYNDVFQMMQIMIESPNKKIICAAYPKKHINWNSINDAYKLNKINNPEDAQLYSSEFVLNYKNQNKQNTIFRIDEPVAVKESGTGFMMIHREVFEKFSEAYPEQNSFDPISQSDLFYYFDCKIDPETNVYLSEDYMFCQWASKIGYDTWVLPWVHLAHMGTYQYEGSFLEHSKFNYQVMQAKEHHETK